MALNDLLFSHHFDLLWCLLVIISGLLFILISFIRSKQRVRFQRHDYVPTIFVTGCDSGFGKQLSLQLARKGHCRVVAGCLTNSGCEELQNLALPNLFTVMIDVANEDSVQCARKEVDKILNGDGLWGLVNNAGVATLTGFTDWTTKREISYCMSVNSIGLMDVTRQFLPLIKKAKGRIVNMSSIGGRLAFGDSVYCASKFAVEGFSDCLRREVASWGVNVCLMEPGYFQTSLTSNNNDRLVQLFKSKFQKLESENNALYRACGSKFYEKNAQSLRENLSLDRLNPNLRLVTDNIERALFSKYPSTRYACGNDAKFFFIPLSNLPTWFSDWLLGLALNKLCRPEGDLSAL